MNTILTLVNDDPGRESRLKGAIDLAHALSGHLICLATDSQVQLATSAEQAGHQCKSAPRPDPGFQTRLEREDVPWELVRAAGDRADCVIQRAGLADVIVMNSEPDLMGGFESQSLLSRVAIRSRKPIVVMPKDEDSFDVYGRALIAWDGSAPAMAALTAAVPLLKWARSVTIFEVVAASAGISSDEAVAYLMRNEIHAGIRRFAPGEGKVADMLYDSLLANSADYCVMGAYGHSPLYEAVFGGVTRRMLAISPVPLVIAH